MAGPVRSDRVPLVESGQVTSGRVMSSHVAACLVGHDSSRLNMAFHVALASSSQVGSGRGQSNVSRHVGLVLSDHVQSKPVRAGHI
jgi:hypothetical protein